MLLSVDDLVGPLPSFPRGDSVSNPVPIDPHGTGSRPPSRGILQDFGPAKLLHGVLSSLLRRLQGRPDVLFLPLSGSSRGRRRPQVRPDEESRKEVGEGGKVDDVEPDGKGLSASVEAGDPGFVAVLETDDGFDGRSGGGELVVDKEVEQGRTAADDELGDLRGGQGSLDRLGHADVERGDGVVGVL